MGFLYLKLHKWWWYHEVNIQSQLIFGKDIFKIDATVLRETESVEQRVTGQYGLLRNGFLERHANDTKYAASGTSKAKKRNLTIELDKLSVVKSRNKHKFLLLQWPLTLNQLLSTLFTDDRLKKYISHLS